MNDNQRKKIIKAELLETFAEIIDTLYGSTMGASGQNHAPGQVPDPGTTAGTSKFLCEDGTWKEPSGGSGGGNISVMGGSGSEHASGLVPDPGSIAGTSKFLCEDGTWKIPSGSGESSSNEPEIVKGYLYNGNFYVPGDVEPVDYVEIGNLKWATKNIGATSITDGGLYFQWADTQGYTAAQCGSDNELKYFYGSDYKYYDGDRNAPNKYSDTDNKTTLDIIDDAARANWGGSWRLPTKAECQTLISSTTLEVVNNYQDSGISGYIYTDSVDNSKILFIPKVGYCDLGLVQSNFNYLIWTSTRDGFYLYAFILSGTNISSNERHTGIPIRAVWDGEGTPVALLYIEATPSADKLYVDTRTNKIYLYNGNTYYEIGLDISNKEDILKIITLSSNQIIAVPNKYYKLTNTVSSLSITLPSMSTTTTKLIGIMFSFTTRSSPSVTIRSASSLTISYFENYGIQANRSYELNCLWNGTKWVISYGTLG